VDDPSLLEGSLLAARKKSMAVYGSDSLLIEKQLSSVRHIEFQVLGDLHGKVIHCLERECSVQRRHQKLIEESPSPVMTEPLRKKMGKAAIAIAKAVNYTNAGTVEFVLGDDGAFFFLEMNTRLQVEHPVTEAVTGLDLVEMQITIAEGEPLCVSQADISINGHAIECRVYAEDPDNDFVPSAGNLLLWRAAVVARTDSGVATSSRITIDFDPLMAKVIAHADTRANAIRKMDRALHETAALGVVTNIDFLSRLVMGEAFTNGRIKTDFFDKASPVMEKSALSEEDARMLVMAAIVARFNDHEEGLRELGWQAGYHVLKFAGFLLHGDQYSANYRKKDGDSFTIVIQKDTYDVFVAGKDTDSMALIVNGKQLKFSYALDQETVFLHSMNLGHHRLTYLSRFHSMEFQHHKKGAREAPMDGKVALVMVQQGQTVEKDQDLIIIESMKMENIITAAQQGVVKEIFVKQGDFVKMRSILIEIDTENNP
jgi:acetyl/propionyl-CoA carboxylase alpha subunit